MRSGSRRGDAKLDGNQQAKGRDRHRVLADADRCGVNHRVGEAEGLNSPSVRQQDLMQWTPLRVDRQNVDFVTINGSEAVLDSRIFEACVVQERADRLETADHCDCQVEISRCSSKVDTV